MKSPQFRVLDGVGGGAILVMNERMRAALIDLLEDLTDRSTHETALMHALRESGGALSRGPSREGAGNE